MTTHVMTQTTSSAAAQSSADRPTGRPVAAAPAGNGLNGALPTGANHILHAHVLGRAVQSLQAKYTAVEKDVVHATVNAAYRELNRTARLKTYLPTLAIRQAEDHLRGLVSETTGHRVMSAAAPAAA